MKKVFTLFSCLVFVSILYTQQTFTNFQNASMVIGQPDFQSRLTTTNDSITRGPSYCAISSKGMLAVAEQTGYSVKIWHVLPTRNGQPSDIQISLPFYAEGVDWSPDGNKLIVAGGTSYIYIWDTIPTIDDQPADVTISLYTGSPQGVLVTPGGKLLITERYRHRILVWNAIPTVNNTPADYVVGQPDMATTSSGSGSGKLNQPWGLDLSPDGKLLVADEQNHRVVIYDSVPVTFGDTATVVIGQTDFGRRTSGVSDTTISTPVGVTATVDGKVAVSEFGNHRVTIWDSVPASHGEAATTVLGQPDLFTSISYNPSGTPDTNNMRNVYTISSDLNGRLFLCGRDMHRVMVFGDLPTDSADLSITITESSSALCDSSDVVYYFKIFNPGPDSAKNIVSTTAFPEGYQVDYINVIDGTYNSASGYWEIPFIAPNDSAELVINGIVNGGMSGQTITTYASIINSSAIDTNLNNNGTSVSVTILAITKPGDPITSDTETCYDSPATLSASGEGTLYWYADIDDIDTIATGSVLVSDPITENSTFYVVANNGCFGHNRVPVQVEVNATYHITESAAICRWESYTFPDGTTMDDISATITHASYLTTVDGCDSIIETTVNVNPVFDVEEDITICAGSSYTFPDGVTIDNINSPLTHVSYLYTTEGCDSAITTNININPVYEISETVSVCSGESYTFPDGAFVDNIKNSISHTSYLYTSEGCDSTIYTTVTINPVYNLTESVSICSGGSYTFPDGTTTKDITSTVVHASHLLTIEGCDSIIVTTVQVIPVYMLSETISVCPGESHTFPDGTVMDNIISDVSHTSNLISQYGCDSIIETTVYMNPVFNLTETIEICSGESYTFPDGTVMDNIISDVSHTSNLSTVSGCDSIIETNVRITDLDVSVKIETNTLIANLVNADYQWINCDDSFAPIVGATGQSFSPTSGSHYAVIITEAGCVDTSECHNIPITTLNGLGEVNGINVYPNPTRGNVTIDLSNPSGNVMVKVLDMNGAVVLFESFSFAEEKVDINLNDAHAGIYIIIVSDENNSSVHRIVKE